MHIEQIANHNLKSLISPESAQALRFDNSMDWIAALRAPKIRELTTKSRGAECGLKNLVSRPPGSSPGKILCNAARKVRCALSTLGSAQRCADRKFCQFS